MVRRRSRSPTAGLRWVFLLALVAVLLSIVGLFLFGRAGRRSLPEAEPAAEQPTPEEGTTTLGEGFEYTLTDGGREVFHIRGDSVRVDRKNNVFLDQVHLTLYGEGGEPYAIESRSATYNRDTGAAHLEGDVHLQGGEGLELDAAAVDLKEKGRVIESQGQVHFRYRDSYIGSADQLRAHLKNKVYLLTGHVRVDSTAAAAVPLALRGDRALLERARALLRVDGDAEIRYGGNGLDAQRMSAFLTDDLRSLRFFRARWDLSGWTTVEGTVGEPTPEAAAEATPETAGETAPETAGEAASAVEREADTQAEDNQEATPSPTVVHFSGRGFSLLLDPERGGPRTAELEGAPSDPATLRSQEQGGPKRVLTAGYLTARFGEGHIEEVEALGRPHLMETPEGSEEVLRELAGDRGLAHMDATGRLSEIDLTGAVEYTSPDVTATGDRSSFDLEAGKGELWGDEAQLTTEQGELEAPHVSFDRKEKLVRADGGVRARLSNAEGAMLDGSPLAQGEGPIRVEAQESFWRQQPPSFLFRGEVKAWRGEAVLLSATLLGEQGEQRLSAGGGVRTVWRPTPGEQGENAGPIRVSANDLHYLRNERQLVYQGRVRVEQEQRTLACRQLEVELGPKGTTERMTCTGDVELADAASGDRVAGDRAVYTVARRVIEISGSPAVMRDAEGKKVEANNVVYDVEQGRVQATGGKPAAPQADPKPAEPAETGEGAG